MSICTRCGAAFGCAVVDGSDGTPCWCTRLPPVVALPPADEAAGCWCPACLAQHIAQRPGAPPPTPAVPDDDMPPP
ncbi:MAG: cysteine-rich CWC family protein [Massilia sp.]|nr:cysteine-rich CWC family protein [Massilia sp.]